MRHDIRFHVGAPLRTVSFHQALSKNANVADIVDAERMHHARS
jgi:hypothetical protein